MIRHKEYPNGWHLVSAHLFVRDLVLRELEEFSERLDVAGGEDWDLSKRAHSQGLTVGISEFVKVFETIGS